MSISLTFDGYQFFIHRITGSENSPAYIKIESEQKIYHEQKWLRESLNHPILITEKKWSNLSHNTLISYFTDLTDRLKKNNIFPPDPKL